MSAPLQGRAWANVHVPLDLHAAVALLVTAVRDGQPQAAVEAFLPLLRQANDKAGK